MRVASFLSLFIVACGASSEPARSNTPAGTTPAAGDAAHDERGSRGAMSLEPTHFEGEGIVLDLPGRWVEHSLPGARELRKGDREQIIITRFPPIQGLDSVGSAARLAEIQVSTVTSKCKRPGDTGAPMAATNAARALRSYVVCEEPRVVATFFATPLECDVLSFEHYWYGARAFSSELGRADDAILATLQIKQTGACAALTGAAPLLSANE